MLINCVALGGIGQALDLTHSASMTRGID